MAVAALDPRSLLQEAPPELAAFLQFYGAVCSLPAVAMVGLGAQGAAIDLWVRLSDDGEASQDALYGALQRYRAGGDELLVDLHVIFADEDDAAWPAATRVVFVRGCARLPIATSTRHGGTGTSPKSC